MSKSNERLDQLETMLQERGVLHLKDAARSLGVSEMTIRRDIASDNRRFAYLGGHIMSAHAVEPEHPYELSEAQDRHAQAKQVACSHALAHIRAEDTIFVDCGSTLMHLVDLLPPETPVTVLCYSLNIAERLARRDHLRFALLGGFYHPASASFAGASALAMLDDFGINTAFLSAAGLDPSRGATCMHFHEAEIKRKAMAVASRNVLVLDNSKIGRVRPAFFGKMGEFDAIYTEDGLYPINGEGA